MSSSIKFAGYPDAFVYVEPNKHSKWVNHLLWGEWVQCLEENDDWVKVNVRGTNDGWMLKSQLQDNKLIELYFVDIGQGDGCLAIFPDGKTDDGIPKDRAMLIDAGQNDNMLRFINWKFNTKNDENPAFKFDDVIISHSDMDHYLGFQAIFENPRFEFKNVYHNGLVERAVGESLGSQEKIGKLTYQTDVIETHNELEKIISNPAAIGRKLYPKLLKTAAGRGTKIRMMCNQDKYLPGFGDGNEIKIRVLAPVIENAEQYGKKRLLRRFKSNDGKTKNGHSIVLRLEYGGVKILIGGDLNVPAENFLLEHYGKGDPNTKDPLKLEALILEARKHFESDVAKACHHGSGDFSTSFLRAVNATATVVSSGDDEPHCHPRPNTLGALGKYGRGKFPLIFSTEMARSAKEKIKWPGEIQKEIENLQNEALKLALEIDSEKKEQKKLRLEKQKKNLFLKLGRTVEVYGMINVRTDGKNVLIAQKLEQAAERGFWDIHCLEPIKQEDGTTTLVYADGMEKHD
jgi:beta-lactamase superfamily II metal-dependent hydrolase